MLLSALLFPLLLPASLPVQDPPHAAAGEHGHGDDFTSMLEHHAFSELTQWRERHPWRVGTEIRKFILRYGEERAKGDPQVDRVWNMHAAFLAEAVHDDVYTGWLMTVHNYDVEARAMFDSVRTGLADIAASIATGPASTDASILAEIDGLRPPIAPPWCIESCLGELTRIAEAARAKGHVQAAVALAREAQAIAEKARDGEIALWCARFLLQVEQAAGRKVEASGQLRRLLEAAGAVEELPDGFEGVLADAQKAFSDEPGVAAGIDSLRAVRMENEGDDVEAYALWKTALQRSMKLRPAVPELEQVEAALYGPDPVRRGALSAARMGRYDDAFELGKLVCAGSDKLQGLAKEDKVLMLVVDRAATVVLLSNTPETRGCIVQVGAQAARDLVVNVRQSLHKFGAEGPEPPTIPFDPTYAHEAYVQLLGQLYVPIEGRIGVLRTTELEQLPFGVLVPDELPEPPTRAKYLLETVTILKLSEVKGLPTLDESTRPAVRRRLEELGAKPEGLPEAVRAIQLEMIGGRGPLGAERKHPWYWADLELAAP